MNSFVAIMSFVMMKFTKIAITGKVATNCGTTCDWKIRALIQTQFKIDSSDFQIWKLCHTFDIPSFAVLYRFFVEFYTFPFFMEFRTIPVKKKFFLHFTQ